MTRLFFFLECFDGFVTFLSFLSTYFPFLFLARPVLYGFHEKNVQAFLDRRALYDP